MKPKFFPNLSDFRKWLEKNHDEKRELLVGFYKKASGVPSITWSESVDQAICFGWIDGIRRSIDDISYSIRFTPRKSTSNWSAINIDKVKKLRAAGLMHPAGIEIFERRDRRKSQRYSFERKQVKLARKYELEIKSDAKAWEFYRTTTPSYRTQSSWWVMSAKKEETRRRRLGILIECSASGSKIPPLDWKK